MSKPQSQIRYELAEERIQNVRKGIAAQLERKAEIERELEQLQIDHTQACSSAAIQGEAAPERPPEIAKLRDELDTIGSVLENLKSRFDEANAEHVNARDAHEEYMVRKLVKPLELEASQAWNQLVKAYEVLCRTTGVEAFYRFEALAGNVFIHNQRPSQHAAASQGLNPGFAYLELPGLMEITDTAAQISARL